MAAPMSERDLREIEAGFDGSEPYYTRELIAEIRRLRAQRRGPDMSVDTRLWASVLPPPPAPSENCAARLRDAMARLTK